MATSPASGTGPSAMGEDGGGLTPDLKKRIEIMAEHITKNGPGFEGMVKQKNVNNPQFAFLYPAGEGHSYYEQMLAKLRGGDAGSAPPAAGGASSVALDSDTTAAFIKWKEPPLYQLAVEIERQADDVITSLEAAASKDLIRSSRQWMEQNASMGHQIGCHLMKRIANLKSATHRLHVLYAVHDVLQTEATSKISSRSLISAFKPYLVWMLRPCWQLAMKATDSKEKNEQEAEKVLRLVTLWQSRDILDQRAADEFRLLVKAKELPAQHVNAAIARGSGVPGTVGPGGLTGVFPGGVPSGMMRPGMPQPGMMMQQQQGGKTPETVPVGIMAQMMKEVSQRAKNMQTAFVPYRPLDPMFTPQTLPPDQPASQKVVTLLDEFYRQVKEEDEREHMSPSPSRSRSRSPKKKSRWSEGGENEMLEGSTVIVQGIQSAPELNGQVAKVLSFDAGKGRYVVELPSGAHKSFKPDNLVNVNGSAKSQALSDAPSTALDES
eukprot:gnl/MRDRNA2_/MRDRNA2_96376_c0_seq1.p1 gnl/MRDRNA2_/MRDRNA2_96376_c0~~gnl/MRDRNA2_/MRDRNA2_96376_c0_seq1.p1  ORF type:complete len:493 (-),score=104.25 gnl/MRDRNA2_/MRDRNA2_96376_c0_seq1:86-1564(-)